MKINQFLITILLIVFFAVTANAGPYAPAAGENGSTAIYMDDDSIVGWATGYENYMVGTNVDSSWQTPGKALSAAVGDSYDIVSLGRGGEITLTFDAAIKDGDGYDFAVFENSFSNTFLELAYVEVSSDGTNFFRFANDSLTDSSVGSYGSLDPTNITGLAGKYRQGYGTCFDLSELAGTSDLLDIYNVSYVKFIDIIGDGTYFDTDGDVIYDPYPTIGSAGFDLDAVGVMNAVPVPAALWLFGSGIAAMIGIRKKKCNKAKNC